MPAVAAAPTGRSAPGPVPAGWAYTAFIAVCVIAALYVAREILVPIALAILLSFVLAPVVRLLRRLHIGRTAAVVVSVTLAFLIIFACGFVLTRQITQLAENLPRYESNLREKAQALRLATSGSRTFERVSEVLQDLKTEISKPNGGVESQRGAPAPAGAAGPPAPRPIAVEVQEASPAPLETVQDIIAPFLQPLVTTSLVIVFAIFILLYREDLRDRFIRVFGTYDLHRTTEAMNEAASRLSRFFLVQTGLNAAFGVFIGIGLWLIGVPNPILWGVIAGLMRFVPYIGTFIAAGFPALLAVAVDPGWSLLIWTVALFVLSEPVMGQIVEPWAFGHSTGLSPIAVIVSATFWLWLWGPIGLLLATPLTLCLMVLGRHVERMQFFEILLGDQPALTPDKSFYQRMLAADPYEVAEQAERYLKEHPLSAYYDEVAMQGLVLADLDAREGRLDDARLEMIRDSVAALLEDLADHEDVATPGDPASALEPLPAEPVPATLAPEESAAADMSVLCVPVHTPLDEAAALILAQLLERHGLSAQAVPLDAIAGSALASPSHGEVQVICLSFFGASAGLARPRYLIRRLKRRFPGATTIACFWNADLSRISADALNAAGAAKAVRTARDAVAACVELAKGQERSGKALEEEVGARATAA